MTPDDFLTDFAPRCFKLYFAGRDLMYSVYDFLPNGRTFARYGYKGHDPLGDFGNEERVDNDEERIETLVSIARYFEKALQGIEGFGYGGVTEGPTTRLEPGFVNVDIPEGSQWEWREEANLHTWRSLYQRVLMNAATFIEEADNKEFAAGIPLRSLRLIANPLWVAEVEFLTHVLGVGEVAVGRPMMAILERLSYQGQAEIVLDLLEWLPRNMAPTITRPKVTLDPALFSVRFNDLPPCELGNTQEYQLLAALIEHEGSFVPHSTLLKATGRDALEQRLDDIKHRLLRRLVSTDGYQALAACIRTKKGHYGLFLPM